MGLMKYFPLLAYFISALLLASCSSDPEKFADVDSQRLLNADTTPEEWLTYGGTYDEQRHSGLTQIDTNNVSKLGVAWTYDLATARGVESTPIVVDGVMYVPPPGQWFMPLTHKRVESSGCITLMLTARLEPKPVVM
tara:strand:- start:81 stop:491 length:411 start_codon:yes stop_codon:yes gene_type:complete